MEPSELKFRATERGDDVSALLLRPPNATALLVLGHGAGAGMRHHAMEATAETLAEVGIATLRYQFPYMERGGGGLDGPAILIETVRSAVTVAAELAPDLPLLAGGRSMGGRMTSQAAAASPLPGVRGLVFHAFPLHPAGKPGIERAEHLAQVQVPLLFLQGTRDALAELELLRPVVVGLGDRATLHLVETADHSFKVQKRSGLTDQTAMEQLARVVADWARDLPGNPN
jgi:predicted alpha/beta-hydrolase family hydrolase